MALMAVSLVLISVAFAAMVVSFAAIKILFPSIFDSTSVISVLIGRDLPPLF